MRDLKIVLRKTIEEQAEELAEKANCHYETAENAILAAIVDSLVTEDSELNKVFIEENIDWNIFLRDQELKREKEWIKDGKDIDIKVEEKALKKHFG